MCLGSGFGQEDYKCLAGGEGEGEAYVYIYIYMCVYTQGLCSLINNTGPPCQVFDLLFGQLEFLRSYGQRFQVCNELRALITFAHW